MRRGGYELLGITAVTPLIVDAWTMAKEGKRLGLTTVLGGPHLTLMPEESIGPEHPEVDYVIQGEAEESIVEFVDALEGRRAMETVHGLYWRKNGEIVVNPPSRPDARTSTTSPTRRTTCSRSRATPTCSR